MTLSLLLMVLAVARVTRLVTTDVLLDPARGWLVGKLIRHEGEPTHLRGKLAYLLVCDWCASMYVGVAGAGAWWAWGETMPFMVTCAALSASYVAGFLASKTEG